MFQSGRYFRSRSETPQSTANIESAIRGTTPLPGSATRQTVRSIQLSLSTEGRLGIMRIARALIFPDCVIRKLARSPVGGHGADGSGNLDAHIVVDGMAKLLLTAEVTLCRLDGGVAQKKLNLVQFPSTYVTQPRTRSP
jgi:hypothetical protein